MAEQFEEFDDFKVAEDTTEIENMVANTIVAKEPFSQYIKDKCYTE